MDGTAFSASEFSEHRLVDRALRAPLVANEVDVPPAIVEILTGDYLDENDIIRLADEFGRDERDRVG